MKRALHLRVVLLVIGLELASAKGVCQPAQPPDSMTAGPPPIPSGVVLNNPFQTFRVLLAATAAERESVLASKSSVHRRHLEERLKEFGSMEAAEREIRLRMMELRWFLVPLFRTPASNRAERLAAVPDGARQLVEVRLKEWEALPADLRQEVLQHGITLQYFARLETVPPTEQVKLWNSMGRDSKPQPAMNADQWRAMAADRKHSVSAQLERFFVLSAEEKQRTLQVFSAAERQHVDGTLKKFQQLPEVQRKQCLDSFQKYAELSENARIEFLKNAQRWKAMPVDERKAWRSLITKLPPMPPGLEATSQPPNPG